jgi:hypothetical protein
VSIDAGGAEAPADWNNLKSGENYLGNERTENFSSPGGADVDRRRVYKVPSRLGLNQWALEGDWTVGKKAIVLNTPNGHIARLSRPRSSCGHGPGTARHRHPLSSVDRRSAARSAHGLDVDAGGNGSVNEQRLYQLIRQPKPITDRRFEIEFLDPGVEAFAFTFG